MPDIGVTTPDGGVAYFPEGTHPDTMRDALRAKFGGGPAGRVANEISFAGAMRDTPSNVVESLASSGETIAKGLNPVHRAQMGALEGTMAAGRALAEIPSAGIKAAGAALSGPMAAAEHWVGTLLNPEVAIHDVPSEMYEKAAGELTTALSAVMPGIYKGAGAIKSLREVFPNEKFPSTDEVFSAGSKNFNNAVKTDVAFPDSDFKKLQNVIWRAVRNDNAILPEMAPTTNNYLKQLRGKSESEPPIKLVKTADRKDPGFPGRAVEYTGNDTSDNPVLKAYFEIDGNNARLEDIHAIGPEGAALPAKVARNTLGPSIIKSFFKQFRELHPEVKNITANRISGARMAGGVDTEASNEINISIPANIPKKITAVDLPTLKAVREGLSKTTVNPKVSNEDNIAASRATKIIDDYLISMGAARAVKNVDKVPEFLAQWKEGRDNWGVGLRMRVLDQRTELAENAPNAMDKALETQFRNLQAQIIRDPKKYGLNEAEKNQLKRVVQSTPIGRVAEKLGKLSPVHKSTGLAMLIELSTAVGAAAHGDLAVAGGIGGVAAVGAAGKAISIASRNRQLRLLKELVSSRSPLARSMKTTTPSAPQPNALLGSIPAAASTSQDRSALSRGITPLGSNLGL